MNSRWRRSRRSGHRSSRRPARPRCERLGGDDRGRDHPVRILAHQRAEGLARGRAQHVPHRAPPHPPHGLLVGDALLLHRGAGGQLHDPQPLHAGILGEEHPALGRRIGLPHGLQHGGLELLGQARDGAIDERPEHLILGREAEIRRRNSSFESMAPASCSRPVVAVKPVLLQQLAQVDPIDPASREARETLPSHRSSRPLR